MVTLFLLFLVEIKEASLFISGIAPSFNTALLPPTDDALVMMSHLIPISPRSAIANVLLYHYYY